MRLSQEWGTYSQAGIVHIYGSFQTNGSSAPTVPRDGNSRLIGNNGSNGSVTRTAVGKYTVQLDTSMSYPVPVIPIMIYVDNSALGTPTTYVNAYYVEGSWNPSTKTFNIIVTTSAGVSDADSGVRVNFEIVGSIESAGVDPA